MPIGWRPVHPGDPTPAWGPLGRTGCLVFVAVFITVLVIAALVGATRTGDHQTGRSVSEVVVMTDAIAGVRTDAPGAVLEPESSYV